MAFSVGALNATLGLVTNRAEWQRGEAQINHFRRLALGVGAYFGGKWLGSALVGFNRDVENAKNQLAGMLAFARGTEFTAQLTEANDLYDKLRKKAMALPGETQDYVNMLGLITEPLARANTSTEDMVDITSKGFVLAKAFGGTWQEAGRDLRDFIKNGNLFARDKFLRTILSPLGYDANDKSRARLRAKTDKERVALLKEAMGGKAVAGIMEAQGNSFQGRWETVRDTAKQVAGKAGEALFGSLKESMSKLAAWLTANQGTIEKWAAKVGEYINKGFLAARDGVLWLIDHKDILISALAAIGGAFYVMMLRAAGAWLAAGWPVIAGAGLVYMFLKLRDVIGDIAAAFVVLGTAIAAAFAYKRINDWISGLNSATKAAAQLAAVQRAAGMGGGAGSAAANYVNGAGAGFLGPAGASQHPQGAPGGPAAKQGVPGIGALAAISSVGAFALVANSLLDGMQSPESTARANASISKLWSSGSIAEAMKVAQQTITVNQAPVTINVTSNDPVEAAKQVKDELAKRDAEARAAYRNGTGNRGDQ